MDIILGQIAEHLEDVKTQNLTVRIKVREINGLWRYAKLTRLYTNTHYGWLQMD